MPTISSAGIGSGLDVNGIIDGLMAVERRPLQLLQVKREQFTAQISAYGELISSVSAFQASVDKLSTLSALDIFKGTSSNPDVVKVTATDNPDLGSFGIEVARLAEKHQMASKEILDTDTFGGKKATDALHIQVGSDPANKLTIDLSTAKTLAEIRTAINEDVNNPGVTATIINGENNQQKLILKSDDTGADNALTLSKSGKVKLSDFDFQTLNDIGGDTSQLDAEFTVDGYTLTSSSNTVSGVINGVTFELLAKDVGNQHTLSIARDTAEVENLVQSFATAYNDFRAAINAQRSGSLSRDNILLSIENQVRSVLNRASSSGPLSTLSEVGLSIQKDGSMSVDSETLNAALDSDIDAVARLFADESDGFASRLSALADGWIGADGLLSSRTDGLNQRINDLTDRQISIERNLEIVETRYRAQFSALDALVSQFQSTSSFLTSQLAQLPKITTNKSS